MLKKEPSSVLVLDLKKKDLVPFIVPNKTTFAIGDEAFHSSGWILVVYIPIAFESINKLFRLIKRFMRLFGGFSLYSYQKNR